MPPPPSDSAGRRLARRIERRLHAPATAYAALAAAFSTLLIPLPDLPELSLLLNSAHVPLFALVGLIVRSRFGPGAGWGADVATLAAGALIGAGGELLQFWIPGRYPSFGDEFLDLVGLPLGLVAYRLLILERRADS